MSRKVDPLLVRPGDRVRVGRERCSETGEPLHGVMFGAVCKVVQCELPGQFTDIPQVLVHGPVVGGFVGPTQWVAISSCKVAK